MSLLPKETKCEVQQPNPITTFHFPSSQDTCCPETDTYMRVLSWFHSIWLWRHFSGHACHLFATWLHPRGRTTMWNKHQRSRTDGTLITSAREAPFCSGMTRLPAPQEADSTRPPLQTLIAQVPPGRPEVLPGHGAQLQEPPNQGPVFGWSSLQARPSTSPCYRRNRHAKVIPSSVGQQPPGFSLPCGDEGGWCEAVHSTWASGRNCGGHGLGLCSACTQEPRGLSGPWHSWSRPGCACVTGKWLMPCALS